MAIHRATDLAFAHAVYYADAMIRAWMQRTRRRGAYRAVDVPEYIEIPTNEERSRAEVIAFAHGLVKPDTTYHAYLASKTIITWYGDELAQITNITGDSNGSGSFRARGIDGRYYYGRHRGINMSCWMRLCQKQG